MNRDKVDTREKFRATFLAAIMVLSMVGMAFAGGAAALQAPPEDPDDLIADDEDQSIFNDPGASIAANNATPEQNSTHTINVTSVSELDVSDGEHNLTANVTYPSEFDIDGLSGSNDVTLWIDGTEYNTGSENVTVDGSSVNASFPVNQNLNDDERVQIELGDDLIENAEEGVYNVSTQLAVNESDQTEFGDISDEIGLPLSLPGPIGVYASADDTDRNESFTLIQDAVDFAESYGDEVITVDEGEFRERGDAVVFNTDFEDDLTVTAAEDADSVIHVAENDSVKLEDVDGLTISDLEFEGDDNAVSAIVDSDDTVNVTVDSNTFLNFSDTVIDLEEVADNPDASTLTISENVFEGIEADAIDVDSTDLDGGAGSSVDIDNNDITVESEDKAINLTAADNASVTENILELSEEGDTVGINVTADGTLNASITDGEINASDEGIVLGGAEAGIDVEGTELTNIENIGLNLSGDVYVEADDLTVDESLDATGVFIGDDVGNTDLDGVSVTDVETGVDVDDASGYVNITDSTVVNASNQSVYLSDSVGDNLNILENTFTDSSKAINVSADNSDAYVHFNTFEDNDIAVNTTAAFNFTFNTLEDNEVAVNLDGHAVNASANYFGTDYGPGGAVDGNNVQDGGDVVRADRDNDNVRFGPWLTEAPADDDFDDNRFIVLEDNANPFTADNVSETVDAQYNATVGVVVFDDDLADEIGDDADIELIDDDLEENVSIANDEAVGSVDRNAVLLVNVSSEEVDDIGLRVGSQETAEGTVLSGSTDQTYSPDIDDVEIDVDYDTIAADGSQDATVTFSILDEDGEVIDNTGQFTSWSVSNEGNMDEITNDRSTYSGDSKYQFNTTEANEEFAVTGVIPGTGFEATVEINSQEGEPSADYSQLTVDGTTDTATGEVDTDLDVEVEIRDAGDNPLEGVTVDLTTNDTDFVLEDEQVTTDEDGEAETTVTLGQEADVTAAVNASAGDFNPDETSDATVNVTTEAADAEAVYFPDGDQTVAPDTTVEITVQGVDEFGNVDEDADDTITLETDDEDAFTLGSGEDDEIEVDLDGGETTFDLNSGDEAGANATITGEADNLDEDSFNASIGEAEDIHLTWDNESIAYDVTGAPMESNLTAQLVDEDGDAISIDEEELRFTRETPSGERGATIIGPTQVDTNESGTVDTFQVEALDRVAETEFEVTAPDLDLGNTTTIQTTGEPDVVEFEANETAPQVNDTVEVTMSIIGGQDNVVPVTMDDYIDLSTDLGDLNETDVDVADGVGVVELTSNESGTATLDAFVATEGIDDTYEIEFAEEVDEEADFQLSDLDAPSVVEQGDGYNVTVNVTNEGDADGTQDVTYELVNATDDEVEIELVEEDVELDAGNYTEVEFEVEGEDTEDLLGDFTHNVSTDDDEVSADVEFTEDAVHDSGVDQEVADAVANLTEPTDEISAGDLTVLRGDLIDGNNVYNGVEVTGGDLTLLRGWLLDQ